MVVEFWCAGSGVDLVGEIGRSIDKLIRLQVLGY
jgi:hypothetical protein